MSALKVTVGDFMRRDIITIEKSESVVKALELMVKHDVGAVVVTEDHKPVGIVTERDFTKRVCVEGVCDVSVKVGDIMSSPLITIKPNASLFEASWKMIDNNVRRLLVEEDGKIVGIFTQKDLLNKIMETFLALSTI
ncbi:MAG: cyclic nucleotide-binding/CBS domain-containing protein [Candidatus Geothermarchaeales archaeon]